MRCATIAILVTLCVGWAAAEEAVNPPPRPLHKIGDHWTPYEPPTELPADAQIYIIQPGDTLWALAKQYLGDPYLWPQLWEKNTYIRDAHWIYPGDPLIVGVKTQEAPAEQPPAATAEGAGATAEGTPQIEPTPAEGAGGDEGTTPAGRLVPIGSEDDVYCFAYLDAEDAKPNLTVFSSEQLEYQEDASTYDIVYLSGGDAEGVKAGQEYFVNVPVRKLKHPHTGATLGLVVRQLGRVRVLCTQEHTATAEVMASCDAIPIGAWATPYEPYPVPMALLTPPLEICDPPNDKSKGVITYCRDDATSFGADTMVFIDLGEADQVSPGTLFTIFRDNLVEGAPRLLLGELAVLLTGDHWATAKVLSSKVPIRVGDRVELK